MYKQASRFKQARVRSGNRRLARSRKTALMRRLDKEVERAKKVPPQNNAPRLIKRSQDT